MDYLPLTMTYTNLMLKLLIFVKNLKIRYYRIWLHFVNYIYNYINILKNISVNIFFIKMNL